MKPKVSIIVPVYNVENYLNKCLESIKNQTLKDIEIIIVNDGSTDGSYKIIDRFVKEDERFKVINKVNGGLSSARNEGLKYAKSEWICFIDSDDWIEKNMIEVLYNLVLSDNSDLAVCGCRDIYNNKSVVTSVNLKNELIEINDTCNFFKSKRRDLAIVVWNKLYKKEIIDKKKLKFELNNEVFSEDIIFNLCYQMNCKSISCTNEVLYNYLIRDNSIMNSEKPNLVNKFENLINKFTIFCEKNNRNDIIKKFIPILTFELISTVIINNKDKSNSYQKIIRDIEYFRNSSIILYNLKRYLRLDVKLKEKLKAIVYLKINKKLAAHIINKQLN